MPYGLRGYDGNVYGLGLTPYQATLCDPRDIACVAANVAASIAYNQQYGEQQASGNYDQCIANGTDPAECRARWPVGYSGNVPASSLTQAQVVQQELTPAQMAQQFLTDPTEAAFLRSYNVNPFSLVPGGAVAPGAAPGSGGGGAPSPAAPVYSPVATFNTSGNRLSLVPGDTWTISIRGGRPNSQVMVSGGVNGGSANSPMGTTDSSGNWSTSGTITADQAGNWRESWTVGGQPAGAFSFVVVSPASSPGGASSSQTPPISGSGAPAGGSGPSAGSPSVGGFNLSQIPWWGWLGGGAVALWAMGKGKH